MKLKELKKGTYFTLKNLEFPSDSQVWIKGEYDKPSKSYSIINFSDTNRERFIKGNHEIFTDFTF